MGTQGLHDRVLGPRGAARLSRARQAVIVTTLAVLPALAGCSSFSSSSSPAAQTAAVAPPPNVAMAAPAAQPAPDAGVVISPYPRQSLVELFSEPDNSPPPVQYVPRPPSTYTPAGQPYPTNQPAYGAPVAAAPPPVDNTPNLSPYPKQSLVDLFGIQTAHRLRRMCRGRRVPTRLRVSHMPRMRRPITHQPTMHRRPRLPPRRPLRLQPIPSR